MAKHSAEDSCEGKRSVESIVADNTRSGQPVPAPRMSQQVRERFAAQRRPLTVPQQVVKDS